MNFPETLIYPTRKDENWKYTSLKSWLDKSYQLGTSENQNVKLNSDFSYKVVFINGHFIQNQSVLPKGLRIELVDTQLTTEKDSLVLLNAHFIKKTTVISLDADVKVDSALHFIFLTSSAESPSMNFPQVRFDIGDRSHLDLLVEYRTSINQTLMDDDISFVSSWIKVNVGREAQVEMAVLQNQNLTSFLFEKIFFQLKKQSQVKILEVALGGQLSRSEVDIELTDEQISAELLGVYALTANQQSDHYTTIKHLKGHCQSVQLYKGLLSDKSKGVFNGHIFIAQDAQKASSEQLNKNLLLSPDAEVNSKPELEIYADDVKATHGSTIGQIQQEEVFYLQTRGIKKEKAIQLVSEAFVMDVVERLESKKIKGFLRKALQAKGAVRG